MITEEQIAGLRKIFAKGTQGWWAQHEDYPRVLVTREAPFDSILGLDLEGTAIVYELEDLMKIVTAVNTLPALLSEIEELNRDIKFLKTRTSS